MTALRSPSSVGGSATTSTCTGLPRDVRQCAHPPSGRRVPLRALQRHHPAPRGLRTARVRPTRRSRSIRVHITIEDSIVTGTYENAIDFVAVQHARIVGNDISTDRTSTDWCAYVRAAAHTSRCATTGSTTAGRWLHRGTGHGFDGWSPRGCATRPIHRRFRQRHPRHRWRRPRRERRAPHPHVWQRRFTMWDTAATPSSSCTGRAVATATPRSAGPTTRPAAGAASGWTGGTSRTKTCGSATT